MIRATTTGSFAKTVGFLENLTPQKMFSNLDRYGQRGVDALSRATPKESGETADSWGYKILNTPGRCSIIWFNTHEKNGVNVAVILQYGHGTGTGGYVDGRDYINPAMRPIFDQILENVWRQVTNG